MNTKRNFYLTCVASLLMHSLTGCSSLLGGTPVYEKVFSFTDALADVPSGNENLGYSTTSLMEGPDGNFYGTTKYITVLQGLVYGPGTIFKMTPEGLLTTLVQFANTSGDTRGSSGTLNEIGIDGKFYGMTNDGGAGGFGTVFKVSRTGEFTTVAEFTGTSGVRKGKSPVVVFQAPDRNFYGATSAGGLLDAGTIFRMTPGGSLTTLVDFTGTTGVRPGRAPTVLILGSDGNLYGSTRSGGANDKGTVFKLTLSGEFTPMVEFTGTSGNRRGNSPNSLLESDPGVICGTTATGGNGNLGSLFRLTFSGDWTTVVEFNGTNGANPEFPLVKDSTGCIYGLTQEGGEHGAGSIYRIPSAGGFQTIHSFPGSANPFASTIPKGPLLMGRDGELFGTISLDFNSTGPFGTVYEVTPNGEYTVLHVFRGDISVNSTDGVDPSNLVQGSDGLLYGSTSSGGRVGQIPASGIIFRVGIDVRTFETLVGFGIPRLPLSPANPHAGVIVGSDGRLYGTSMAGGVNALGTVFSMSAAGEMKVLHSFNGNLYGNGDGYRPVAGLVQGSDLGLYGVTSFEIGRFGDTHVPAVFRISTAGVMSWRRNLSVLQQFYEYEEVGAALVKGKGSDGALYGPAYSGRIMTVNSTGDVINSPASGPFPALASELSPHGGLLEISTGGNPLFIGTSSRGGLNGDGAIYEFSPGDGTCEIKASLNDSGKIVSTTVCKFTFFVKTGLIGFLISNTRSD